jgi:hypothetical protein
LTLPSGYGAKIEKGRRGERKKKKILTLPFILERKESRRCDRV